ncbi:MAG: radical SAM protein [Candidatus Riflebacteria bacterium]|nr:radical SAM protein [Candidatus Riflebacteria bacterium]
MKTFAIVNSAHPCTELVIDVNTIRAYLVRAGLAEVVDPAGADLIVVSTCAFNQEYEHDAVTAIQQARERSRPGARVIVSGCFPRINPELYARTCQFETLPPLEMEKLQELVPSATPLASAEAHTATIREYQGNRLFMTGIRLKRLFTRLGRLVPFVKPPSWLDTVPMTDWYFVRGATGCLGSCTYCAIKRARGNVRSVPAEVVVSRIRSAVEQGYTEISLAGDDMGCYGADLGTDLPALLEEIVALPGEFRVNIRFVEPRWLVKHLERLMPVFRTGRLHSFCVPLQSGSQRILDSMGRDYDIDRTVEALNSIVRTTRVSSISSIVMVGFPGESPGDFEASYRLLDRCDVNLYQVLKYEGRPGTRAEELDGKVPEELKERRRVRFAARMKLTKFVRLPARVAERIVALRHGPIV